MSLPPCDVWGKVGSFHMGCPEWKDKDFLFLTSDMAATAKWFEEKKWTPCTEKEYLDTFKAWRRGEQNAIVVRSMKEFYGFMAAFHLCKTYKVFNKAHRVLIHESLRVRGYTPCDFNMDKKTREIVVTNAFASDKDQRASYSDDEPPF